ncbi:MAG: hypothetical protein ABIO14_08865, partial [Aeromicrobium sp.]
SIDSQVSNGGEIPADATAVFANVEVQASDKGELRIVKPSDSVWSVPPVVTYQDNGPTSSGVMLRLSSDGKIKIYNNATGTSTGDINFKVDIQGYFSGHSDEGGSYTPLTAATVYASTSTGSTALAGGETRTLPVAGLAGIPDDGTAGAATLSLTVRNWTASGTLTVYNADEVEPPATTNLNFKAGEGVPSNGSTVTAIVELSDDGAVKIRNTSTAPVTFYISAQGWFTLALPPTTPCTAWLSQNHATVSPDITTTATCDGDLAVEMFQDSAGAVSYRVTNVGTGMQETGTDLDSLALAFETAEPAEPVDNDPTVDSGPTMSPSELSAAQEAQASQSSSAVYTKSRSTTKYFAKWEGNNLVTQGWVRVQIRVSLYWHSANLRIITSSNRSIYSNFRLRIRHDVSLQKDTTEFTFPGTYACSVAKSCTIYEDRSGAGYNQLPYETRQKYFYDVYRQDVRYNGDDYPTVGSYQSARATCYKQRSCKFL